MSIGSTAVPWISAGLTFIAVLAALLKEDVQRCWRHPTLEPKIRLSAPDCLRVERLFFDPPRPPIRVLCYYFRIWVKNTGNTRAEKVQIFVSRLSQKQADGSFREMGSFSPMSLKWSYQDENPTIFADGISPDMGRHCDFFHIYAPTQKAITGSLPGAKQNWTLLELDLEAKATPESNLLLPGTYRFELKVAGSNSRPVSKTIEVKHTGVWYPTEERMFRDGIEIL
jgi:hypothetical protein